MYEGIYDPDLSDMQTDELSKKRAEKKTRGGILQMVCMADVKSKPINWLWPEKIARGKVSMIAGDPGLGKSLITIALASAVSTGARWPVGGGNAPQGSVIMLSDEDALDDTIRPRLDAADADCAKIHAIKMVQETTKDGEIVSRSFSLAKDIERLADVLEELGDCVLLVIDPISAYLDGTDSHRNADVRALLSPLSGLAERFNVAIVTVTHLNKGSGNAIYRATGSLAFVAAARSVLAVTKDQDEQSRRLVLPMKNNLGKDCTGMAYKIETAESGAPVVMWEPDPVDIDINEVLNGESDDFRNERKDAIDWLESELSGGPVDTKVLKARANESGHSWRTVRRAQDHLKVKARKTGAKGGWQWWHPDDTFTPSHEDGHEGAEGVRSQGVATLATLNEDAPKASNSTKVTHENAHENAQDAQGVQSQGVATLATLKDEGAPNVSDFDPFGMSETSDQEVHL